MKQSQAAIVLEHWAPGIELTDAQYDQILAKLVAKIKEYDATLAETKEADPLKRQEWWQSTDKRMREIIESVLSAEQKEQASANRLDRFRKK